MVRNRARTETKRSCHLADRHRGRKPNKKRWESSGRETEQKELPEGVKRLVARSPQKQAAATSSLHWARATDVWAEFRNVLQAASHSQSQGRGASEQREPLSVWLTEAESPRRLRLITGSPPNPNTAPANSNARCTTFAAEAHEAARSV